MVTQGLGIGIYTTREAARLSWLRAERIARWVRGYRFRTSTGSGASGPIFKSDSRLGSRPPLASSQHRKAAEERDDPGAGEETPEAAAAAALKTAFR